MKRSSARWLDRLYVLKWWLRCVIIGHKWVSGLDATRPEDRVWGFTKRVCTHCTLVEYAPGAYAGDRP